MDFGRFCTGFLVVMGIGTFVPISMAKAYGRSGRFGERERNGLTMFADVGVFAALPALLAHCGLIAVPAMAMSIIGGLLIYGTIISFTMFFQEEQDF